MRRLIIENTLKNKKETKQQRYLKNKANEPSKETNHLTPQSSLLFIQ